MLPLLRGHFAAACPMRASDFDAAHGTALLHRDGQVRIWRWTLYSRHRRDRADWQRMWKRFFKALTIEERRDERSDEPWQSGSGRTCARSAGLASRGSCPQSGLRSGGSQPFGIAVGWPHPPTFPRGRLELP
ncbi:MAG: hypothetical protein ACLURG_11615 [Gemmiger sp.]